MKTLTIQQPFASLVCCGIKDVENRSWQTKTPPGLILIHAGGKKVPKNFDIDEGPEAKSLYDTYKLWCKSNGYYVCSSKKFNAEVTAHPEWYEDKRKSTGGMYAYIGIKLRE